MLTFSPALDRRGTDYQITEKDIPDALKAFGSGVKVLMVHPSMMSTVEKVVPDGIELLPHAGCAAWEIFGDTQEIIPAFIFDKEMIGPLFLTSKIIIPKEFVDQKPPVTKIPDTPDIPNNYGTPDNMPIKRGRGRPPKTGEVSKRTLFRRKAKAQQGMMEL